ncbi:hypothetical protein KGF56_001205 [Candida oxycetoniae]|uniref:DNA mismatch repair proteins mutS family domain-containing protein n=1 Tax=Candida oxycetoniae TaxID=497107 RepID=A0AAI9T0K1_9ASCO|nr:uncharacterized protein KGF56_001205 [Candida oxycetoniae]KAI3405986.2 hypothetical protein KGF56_001205 [Candida oxycetoniae]
MRRAFCNDTSRKYARFFETCTVLYKPRHRDRLESWDRGGRRDRINTPIGATEVSTMPPLFASIKRIIDQNPSCVSLIQIGQFYELHFDQAEEFGPKLGLKVAYKKTSNFNIPMAGFPLVQIKKYTEMLVHEHGVNVAIVDQYDTQNRTIQNLLHRKVSRIVSPGTLMDESFMNFNQNNYLLAISFPPNMTQTIADPDLTVGLCWIDVSIGETFVQQTTLGNLIADVSRINPSEILVPVEYFEKSSNLISWFPPLQEFKKYFVRYHNTQYSNINSKSHFKGSAQAVRKFLEGLSVREQAALNFALSYINVNLPEVQMRLDLPTRFCNNDTLQMDSRTRETLELTERATTGRISTVGTLHSSIKRTCTQSGSRLLLQWLKAPLTDVVEIQKRQKYVGIFLKYHHLRLVTRQRLQKLPDFIRVIQKISIGTNDDVSNMKALADALLDLEQLKSFLKDEFTKDSKGLRPLGGFVDKFDVPMELANTILDAIIDVPLSSCDSDVVGDAEKGEAADVVDATVVSSLEEDVNNDNEMDSNSFLEKYRTKDEQGVEPSFQIRKDYNETLKLLHDEFDQLVSEEESFLNELQTELSLLDRKATISKREKYSRWSNVLVINAKLDAISAAAEKFQSDVLLRQKRTLTYRSQRWLELQHKLLDKEDSIKSIERNIIMRLKEQISEKAQQIRELGKAVDFLDVTASFAIIAEEHNWSCPQVEKSTRLEIVGGRHPVVDLSLKDAGSMFTPNDSKLNKQELMWVISGPNMGGKSTFLRQNALIVILAQAGSFVPAEKARIGIVDRIFTRIGASDDLYNDLSTFMVEMVETSNILLNATSKSLAIVDEVGRGTSGKEGLAIAYATLVSLLQINQCRTFFATHFAKELKGILDDEKVNQERIRFRRTRVLELDMCGNTDVRVMIDHTLEPGISERSHALEVAKKAGFPSFALMKAEKVLAVM